MSRIKNPLAVVIFLLSLGILLKWVHPTVDFSDSGELITGAYTLGVAHYPGQPLYLLLTHLGHLLPLGEIAFRSNLASAIFGSLSLVLISLWISILMPVILSLGAVFTCFFFLPFLQQCIWSEVYTLFICFFLGILFLLKVKEPLPKAYSLLGLILGLSIAVHYMTILLLPILALGIWFLLPSRNIRHLAQAVLAFLLSLTIFIYLPLRGIKHPYLNWGSSQNYAGFLYHLLVQQRGGSLPNNLLASQFKQMLVLGKAILSQFNWGGFLVLLVFIYPFLEKKPNRTKSIFLFFLTGATYLLPAWFLKFNNLGLAAFQGPKFFLLTYFLLTYIIFGSFFLLECRFFFKSQPIYQLIFSLLVFLLIHPQVLFEIKVLNKNASYFYAYDYSQNLLKIGNGRKAVYFSDDTFGFPALYQLVVLGKSPQLKLIHLGNIFTSWGVENMTYNYPDLLPSYLKNKPLPYSPYQLGPKFIKEFILEKGEFYALFAPFPIADVPLSYQNYPLKIGYQIAKNFPPSAKTILITRGFKSKDFALDYWTQALAFVYR